MPSIQAQDDAFSDAPVGLACLGLDGSWLKVNPQLCEMLDYEAEQLQMMRFQDVTHPEDLESDQLKIERLMLQRGGEYSLSKRLLRRDGSSIVVHLSVRLVLNEAEEAEHFVIAVHNMSKTHQRLEQLERRTRQDRLTKIRNRAGLIECLRDAYRAHQRHGAKFALAYLDLDGFKQINDTHGHVTGDMLLKGVAARLTDAVGRDGMVARMGGDEFAIVLHNLDSLDQMHTVGDRIQTAFAPPFFANGRHVSVSASIGYAHCPGDARSVRGLLQHADRDMYARKYAANPSRQSV